ncbi:hypothetical protein FZEAL_1370 [Fusarium zealandicum]|uniref:lytic cellulose monooxygenase (C4-dehydrogenating) n=1 Tax=Fusarium zealandicum TaxID=1053134 RepID=A0A8H4UT44_9HYPO|nr:hypothetical protein FZEAL_1370 [Fusarium zealandicum]
MRFNVATALAMASTVSGHALMQGVWVDGKDQGAGRDVYIRSPPNNSPVKDLTSPDIVCNVNGAKAAPEFVKAAAGSEVSFEWYHDNRGDDIIDASHKGPIITYIAEYTETDGTGAIWSKIDEAGYDGSEWAVDALIANKGKYDFTLPKGLKAGKYLVRQEIIAHHESDTTYDKDAARGAQFYPSCVQMEVTGSGSDVPSENFDFNKGYKYTDAGIHFNLYGASPADYKIPGPAVWSGGSGSGSAPAPSAPAASSAAAPVSDSAPVATSAAEPVAGEESAAPTKAAGGNNEPSYPAPTPTFATVVRSEAAGSATQTEAAPAPVKTKTGCSSRRRRSMKHAKKHAL